MRFRPFFALATMSVVGMISCSKTVPPNPPIAASEVNDSLSKYTIEEMRHALDDRRNQTMHSRTSGGLNEVTDRDLVNGLIRREKMIYPHDIRKDYYEFSVVNPDYLRDSASVAALVKPDHYHLTQNGLTLISKPMGEVESLCSGQSFFEQPAAAYCSAFVVGPNLIATAGHCVTNDWKSVRIVFGYEMVRDGTGIHLGPIGSKDVYAIKDVIARQVDEGGKDFAIIQTDRIIEDHPPLARRLKGTIEPHEGVYTLGYPSGLPLKLADGASVSSVSAKGFFQADLDTYGGNSGSPVLNASNHVVEGILVRGLNDYRYISEDKCYKALVCPTYNGCSGEDVTLISSLNEAGSSNGILISQPSANTGEKALVLNPRQSQTKQFSSGPVISGSRKSFSGEYVVASDPAPEGYKIGRFSYSLAGDRACNAWSTCSTRVEDGRVVFRFSLQGHDEWAGSGQAYSTGTLTVTYDPI